MDIKFEYSISSDEFLEVVESVGWETYSHEQIDMALNNTMYMVKALVNGKLAGIGKGIGLKIVNELKRLIEDGVKEGEKMQIELTPTAGKEEFYKKAGFKYKPDVITGMYLWIKK